MEFKFEVSLKQISHVHYYLKELLQTYRFGYPIQKRRYIKKHFTRKNNDLLYYFFLDDLRIQKIK